MVVREVWVAGSGGSSLRTGNPGGCKDAQRGGWAWETLPTRPHHLPHISTCSPAWVRPALPWAWPHAQGPLPPLPASTPQSEVTVPEPAHQPSLPTDHWRCG